MCNDLTSVLENWRAAGTLREDSLLLAEWLAVELCGYLYGQLDQDRGQFDRWLREFGDQVCRSQMHAHPAGPTAVEIMSVVADELGARSVGPAGTERLGAVPRVVGTWGAHVRYSVWDKQIRDNFDRRQLPHQQRSLLEGLLRCLEPGAYLSEHVSTANSTVVALTRAHQAPDGHAAGGQPQLGLLKRCLKTAASTVAAGLPAHQVLGDGLQATQAHALLASLPALLTGTTSKATAATYAPQVHAHIGPIAACIRTWATSLWDGPVLPPDVLARARGEVAALITLEGRDPRSLHVDLIRKGSRAVHDAASITAVLWPAPRTYRVAVVVEGAHQLEHLDKLLSGARQSPLHAPRPVTVGAKELTAYAAAITGPAVMVDLPVTAADPATAVARARRQIGEALDQYAAGQRLVDLTAGRRAVTAAAGTRLEQHDLTSASISIARPLTTHWPVSLRPALRSSGCPARRSDGQLCTGLERHRLSRS